MSKIILLNKPYCVLSQFTDLDKGRATLADLLKAPGFRPAGRLDYDSEGLLLLTDDGRLQQRIANPRFRHWKTYWVQVEGDIDEPALRQLRQGLTLKDGHTLPARAKRIDPPRIWPRNPPVRERKSIPDSWLQLSIQEGRNRQVRRMTAAVGFPTLRLVRSAIDRWELGDLQPGQYRELTVHTAQPRAARGRKK
jgi:23S rRNA pseudouridine2457 synthase